MTTNKKKRNRPVTGVRQNTPLTGFLPKGSPTTNVVSSVQK
jgi:hypothetical protein